MEIWNVLWGKDGKIYAVKIRLKCEHIYFHVFEFLQGSECIFHCPDLQKRIGRSFYPRFVVKTMIGLLEGSFRWFSGWNVKISVLKYVFCIFQGHEACFVVGVSFLPPFVFERWKNHVLNDGGQYIFRKRSKREIGVLEAKKRVGRRFSKCAKKAKNFLALFSSD